MAVDEDRSEVTCLLPPGLRSTHTFTEIIKLSTWPLESGSIRNSVIDKMLMTIKIYLVAVIFLHYQTQL